MFFQGSAYQTILKNYRPVSNLTFVFKILEKVVLKQLEEHLVNNELMDVLQSAIEQNPQRNLLC